MQEVVIKDDIAEITETKVIASYDNKQIAKLIEDLELRKTRLQDNLVIDLAQVDERIAYYNSIGVQLPEIVAVIEEPIETEPYVPPVDDGLGTDNTP